MINFEYVNEKEFMPNSSNEEPDDGAGKALTPSLTKNIKGVEMNLENGVSAGCEMMNFAEAQRELKRTQEENELKDKTIEQLKAELKKELDEKQTKWADYLNNVKQLRITGEKTDITFTYLFIFTKCNVFKYPYNKLLMSDSRSLNQHRLSCAETDFLLATCEASLCWP